MIYCIQDIAADIKAAREKKGLSQRELGARVGAPQSHISKIENGKVDLQTSSLIQIARALDLELVLVPPKFIPAIQALSSNSPMSKALPAYRLTDEEEEGEDV
jgi:transcriptional regulator with XRE-family HTH domain